MIDRALTKQPAAALDVAETAELIAGSGHAYRHGVAAWSMIVDQLVKPTFDGAIAIDDLAGAIAQARAAIAPHDLEPLQRTIGQLRAGGESRAPAAATQGGAALSGTGSAAPHDAAAG